ncbi:MAG: DUF3604 domain-containing protein [Planctomycetota bacterium]
MRRIAARLSRSLALPLAVLATLLVTGSCGEDADPAVEPAVTPPETEPTDQVAYDHPALATRSNGDTWLACIAWEDGVDQLEMRRVTRGDAASERLYRSATRMLGTALAADADDVLHVVWTEQQGADWVLRELTVAPSPVDGELGAPGSASTLLAEPGAHLLEPGLVRDAEGRLLLTWLAVGGDEMAVMACVYEPGSGWGAPVEVSASRRSNWSPSATAVGPGRFAVVWDGAVDGDYDVMLARVELADGAPTVVSRHRVTDSPRFEAHPTVASDGTRLYVAYDVGPERWGREGSINKLEEALHGERTIEVMAIEDDRMAPFTFSPTHGINDALRNNCERPVVICESTGNLVLFFRGLPLPLGYDDPEDPAFGEHQADGGGGKGFRTSIWFTYMTRYDGAEWQVGGKHHQGLPGSEGRNDAPVAVTSLLGGGVAYAVVGDGRDVPPLRPGRRIKPDRMGQLANWWRPVTSKPTAITAAMVQKAKNRAVLPMATRRPLPELRGEVSAPRTTPARTLEDGRAVQVSFGDLHRHTDLSRCSSNWDGPIDDALRYARDVAPLDFLAITDHFEHMSAYDWWRSMSVMDAWNDPGRMVTLRAYERSDFASGHRNVISGDEAPPLIGHADGYRPARDDALATTIEELWAALAGKRILTIPHTPAGMFPGNPARLDWAGFDPTWDRLLEVFQGYRGSSEAPGEPRAIADLPESGYVRPNLDLGLHFGLIASSDHQSSDGSFAGAWVTDVTRDGVFDALHERRTFASTVRASLWVDWNGVPMGTSVQAEPSQPGSVLVEVDGFGRRLDALELIVDGGLAESRQVSGSAVSERFALETPATGTSYAYVRVRFMDGELMWSSPVRMTVGGWDGEDGPSGAQILERQGDVWSQRGSTKQPGR